MSHQAKDQSGFVLLGYTARQEDGIGDTPDSVGGKMGLSHPHLGFTSTS